MPASQTRRQDLAAGGAKNQKEGPKTRRGGHIFKTQYWGNRGAKREMGGTDFKWEGLAPLPPPLATALHKVMILALLGSSGMQRRRQQVAIGNDTPLRPVVCLHIWGAQEEYHLAHVQCHSISCWYLREPPPARLLHLDYQDWTVWSGDYKKRRFLRKSKGFWQTLKR